MNGMNLQLFALTLNTKTSVVDYLKSVGQDSSYNNRKKIATQYGISNYTGSESQNIKLLKLLQESSAASSTSSASNKSTNEGKKEPAKSAVEEKKPAAAQKAENAELKAGDNVAAAEAVLEEKSPAAAAVVEPAVLDNADKGIGEAATIEFPQNQEQTPVAWNFDYNPGPAPTYTAPVTQTPVFNQVQAPTYTAPTTQAQQATSITERLDADTLNTLTSKFQTSQAYEDAMKYTNSLLQQLNGGKTTYTDQISQLINDYQNREKFSYDASTDPLFQQMLSSAMRTGNLAMQDTMGQAAALTGGYGSSYSQAVGSNAYNQYLQGAYDRLPDYYQLAMEAYNQEGNNLLNQISLLDSQDSKEYDRLMNAYNANYNNAMNLYNQEYGAWQDSVGNAYNYAGLLNSDYWNTMDYNEGIRQYEQNFGYQQYQDQLAQSNLQNQFNYQQYADQLSQNNWENEFAYNQYRDQLNQYNADRNFGWQQSEAQREQSNIAWEQGFSQSEANRDQSNIEWGQKFDESEANRNQGNIDWEHKFSESEADREQGNIEWEQNFSQDEANRDQSNIDWQHGFSESEANRDQSNWEKDYLEEQRQYNNSLAEDKRQFNESLTEDKRQFDTSLDFNKSQSQIEQEQWEREMAIKESQAAAKEEGEEYEYKAPTEKMFTTGMEAALRGGEAAVVAYCDTISEYDGFAIVEYCKKKLTFTKTKDTINGMWGLDNNDVYVDGYGQTYTLKQIGDTLGLSRDRLKQLTDIEEGETLDLFTNLED